MSSSRSVRVAINQALNSSKIWLALFLVVMLTIFFVWNGLPKIQNENNLSKASAKELVESIKLERTEIKPQVKLVGPFKSSQPIASSPQKDEPMQTAESDLVHQKNKINIQFNQNVVSQVE